MLSYSILGIIQGIFEWIPISSEGMVALVSQFLTTKVNPVDMALFLHLGTFFAVLIYFRKDWIEVLSLKNKNLLRFLTIATVTSLIVGFFLYNLIKNMVIGSSLLVIMGIGLLFTAYFHKQKKTINLGLNNLAIISGFMQGLSVIPGLSRSASTIFSLSLGKKSPQEILKISYMMSAPVVLASSIYLYLNNPFIVSDLWPALVFSFLVGLFSLSFLLKISQRINFFAFALIFALICFIGAGIQYLI